MYDASPETETRQIDLDGEPHDISLETAYWEALEEIAEREGLMLDEMVEDLRHRVARTLGASAASVREPMLRSAMYTMAISYYRCASRLDDLEGIAGPELGVMVH